MKARACIFTLWLVTKRVMKPSSASAQWYQHNGWCPSYLEHTNKKRHVCFSTWTSIDTQAPLFISVSRYLSPDYACQATSHPHIYAPSNLPLRQNDLFMHLFKHSSFHPSWGNMTRGIPARFADCASLPSNLGKHTTASDRGKENNSQMLKITWPL